MMKLDIYRADPSGNTTALVLSPVASGERAGIAKRLMDSGGWAEQVGFVSGARLDMMGGEFCGNASLSLAAMLAEAGNTDSAVISLSVSGAVEPVICAMERTGDMLWRGTVQMPGPAGVYPERLDIRGRALSVWTAELPGMTHVIVSKSELDRAGAEEAAPLWAALKNADALGVLLFDEAASAMEPLIYVAGTKSLVWEHGCASGTAAVGAFLAQRDKKDAFAMVSQPGGIISAEALFANGQVSAISVGGSVRLLGAETVEI